MEMFFIKMIYRLRNYTVFKLFQYISFLFHYISSIYKSRANSIFTYIFYFIIC